MILSFDLVFYFFDCCLVEFWQHVFHLLIVGDVVDVNDVFGRVHRYMHYIHGIRFGSLEDGDTSSSLHIESHIKRDLSYRYQLTLYFPAYTKGIPDDCALCEFMMEI